MIVLRRTLRSRRRGLIGWGIGIVALIGITVAAYPSIAGQASLDEMIGDYPDFVQEILGLGSGLSISEPAGYLNSQFFSNMLPLLFIIFLISFAVRETATDEREGTLDLVAAHPVLRTRLMIEKGLAQLAAGFGLALLAVLVFVATAPIFDMGEVGPSRLFGATIEVFLVGVVFGGLAFCLGAATGSRGIALGVSSGAAVASYILWGLAPLIDAIQPLERISPFFWALAGDPILHGIQLGNAALLLAVGVGLMAIGVRLFSRRDLKV